MKWRELLYFNYHVDKYLRMLFYFLGKNVISRFPVTIITVGIILALGAGIGLMRIQPDDEYQDWVPTGTRGTEEEKFIKNSFGIPPRQNRIITTTKGGIGAHGNILTRQGIEELFQVYFQVLNIRVEATFDNGTVGDVGLDHLCAKRFPGGPCLYDGFLDYFGFNYTYFKQVVNTDEDILPIVSNPDAQNAYGAKIFQDNVMGGIVRNSSHIISAKAIQLFWYLEDFDEPTGTFPLLPPTWPKPIRTLKDWERDFVSVALQERNFTDSFPFVKDSLSDEVNTSIGKDLIPIAVAYVLVVGYVVLALGERDLVQSKVLLALSGMFGILLSIIFSYGFCCMIGIKFTVVAQVIPFIILGVGVDDMFIIVNSYEATSPNLPPDERVGIALAMAGSTITVTSMTDIVAFFFGCLSSIASIRYFCFYCGVCVFLDYVYQVIWFTACMVLNSRRERGRRVDCVPCIRAKTAYRIENIPSERDLLVDDGKPLADKLTYDLNEDIKIVASAKFADALKRGGIVRWILYHVYSPFILHTVTRICVIIFFIAFIGVAAWGATNVKDGIVFEDLVPSGSYLQDFYDVEKYFDSMGFTVDWIFRDFSYTNQNIQLMSNVTQDVLDSGWIDPNVQFWWVDFQKWYNETYPNTTIPDIGTPAYINMFLQTPEHEHYRRDVAFSADNRTIIASKALFWNIGIIPSNEKIRNMEELRAISDKYSSIPSYPYSWWYRVLERIQIMLPEAVKNMLFAGGAVFVVALIFMPHPLIAFYIMCCIAIVDTLLVAVMTIGNIEINVLSIASLILSIGLAVDYNAHIGHAFMKHRGTRIERVRATLTSMGTSVLSGAFSTFLGIVMLNFGSAPAFKIYFNMLISICLLSLLTGFVLLPVVLSFIGPSPLQVKKRLNTNTEKDVILTNDDDPYS